MKNSIRLELIFIFALCLVMSAALGKAAGIFFQNRNMTARIDYSKGINRMSVNANLIGDEIKNKNISINDNNKVQKIIDSSNDSSDLEKIMITDLNGKVLYKSNNAYETQIDVYTTIKNSIKNSLEMMKNIQNIYGTNKGNEISKNREYISFYPISFSDGKAYLVIKGMPQYEIIYEKKYNPIPGTIVSFISFLTMFYFITNKKMKYIENISSGLIEISRGNLDYRIKSQGRDELALLSNNINFMAEELNNKMKVEREEERIKNELITNVSHDLRTPLTSILGYVELIVEGKYEDEESLKHYADVAYSKCKSLKTLVDDLFEYSKLNSTGMKVNKIRISLIELLEQVIIGFLPYLKEVGMEYRFFLKNEKINIDGDPVLLARMFDNLVNNAVNYGKEGKYLDIELQQEDKEAIVRIINYDNPIPQEELPLIFERFYKVDKSRFKYNNGSGIGLAIVKSIVDMHYGIVTVDSKDNKTIFEVRLPFNGLETV